MELIISPDLKENKLEAVFCPVFEDSEKLAKAISYFAKNKETSFLAQAKKEKFQGQKKHFFVMKVEEQMVILLGLGKTRRLSTEDWRETAAMVINFLQKYQAKNIGLIASQWLQGSSDYERLAQSLAEGLYLANYKFDKYKKIDKQNIQVKIEQIFIELAKEKKE